MKRLAVLVLVLGMIPLSAYSRERVYDETGKAREMKGLTLLYVDAGDKALEKLIDDEISVAAPEIKLVEEREDAEFILRFRAFPIFQHDTGARAYVLTRTKQNKNRLLWKTTDQSRWDAGAERCAQSIAARFVRAYRHAQSR
ncbi:MAG: hypothetical protein WBX15_01255 [Thermoanaerobaculia bacterium]